MLADINEARAHGLHGSQRFARLWCAAHTDGAVLVIAEAVIQETEWRVVNLVFLRDVPVIKRHAQAIHWINCNAQVEVFRFFGLQIRIAREYDEVVGSSAKGRIDGATERVLEEQRFLGRTEADLRRAIEIGASGHHLTFEAHGFRPADGTATRQAVAPGLSRSFGFHDAYDLGDHVPRALNDDGVAYPHVLSLHLVLIVQRSVRNGDSADPNRSKLGHRRERPGAAHLGLDSENHTGFALRRKLEGDGAARCAREASEFRLVVDAIYLGDTAVDLDPHSIAVRE